MASSKRNSEDPSNNIRVVIGLQLPDGTAYSGHVINDVPNGKGTVKFWNGTFFKGEFKDGVPDGPGEIRLSNWEVMKGVFENGIFLGKGRRTPMGLVYHARIREGILEGGYGNTWEEDPELQVKVPIRKPEHIVQETSEPVKQETAEPQSQAPAITFAEEGELLAEEPVQETGYEGIQFADDSEEPVTESEEEVTEYIIVKEERAKTPEITGRRHFPSKKTVIATGRRVYPNGVYEGDFRNSKREGKGLFTYYNGTTVEGDFLNDRPHGHIIMENRENGILFEGEYKNGEMRKGAITINGLTYIGEFRRGLYHGEGKFIKSDGSVLEGRFRWGRYIGPLKAPKTEEKDSVQ